MLQSYQKRSLAFLIDMFCAFLPLLMTLPFLIILYSSNDPQNQLVSQALGFLLFCFSYLLFFAIKLFQNLRFKKTPGQYLGKLKLTNYENENPSRKAIFLKYLLSFLFVSILLVSNMWVFIFLLPVASLITTSGSSLQDNICKTKLVLDKEVKPH